MYGDEKGSEKGEIWKRIIFRAEKFSVDECIKIIYGITQLWKNEGESTLRTFTHVKWPSK